MKIIDRVKIFNKNKIQVKIYNRIDWWKKAMKLFKIYRINMNKV